MAGLCSNGLLAKLLAEEMFAADACRAVVRRIIKADNSCLFNAVAYNLERTRAAAVRLRGVVKDTVKSDPMTFNDGVLGKKNEEYQRWIMDMDHWGGPIELFILAK